MITIRFFRTRKEAERARDILENAGFSVTVSEDKFNNVPIQKFGVRARYRLKVNDEDFYLVTAFLAKKIREGRLKEDNFVIITPLVKLTSSNVGNILSVFFDIRDGF